MHIEAQLQLTRQPSELGPDPFSPAVLDAVQSAQRRLVAVVGARRGETEHGSGRCRGGAQSPAAPLQRGVQAADSGGDRPVPGCSGPGPASSSNEAERRHRNRTLNTGLKRLKVIDTFRLRNSGRQRKRWWRDWTWRWFDPGIALESSRKALWRSVGSTSRQSTRRRIPKSLSPQEGGRRALHFQP